MPFGNRTSSQGLDLGTVKDFGLCLGYTMPGWARGIRFGLGRGFGRRFLGQLNGPLYFDENYFPENETDMMKKEISVLENNIEVLKKNFRHNQSRKWIRMNI
jgi:hypothetical protein